MVKVKHDGDTRHEEKEEHNPELAYAPCAAVSLEEKSDKPEYERQAVEHVVSLVVLERIGQEVLVAEAQVVD